MKKYTLILALLLLSACATKEPTLVSNPISIPLFRPANPRAVSMKDVEWQVLEVKRLQALLDDAKKQNKNVALFAVNTQNYENLSLDMQELKRYILELQQTIVYYKKATEITPGSMVSSVTTEKVTENTLPDRPVPWYKRLLTR